MTGNLDILRGAYEAFARGDVPTVLAVLAPDISWTEAEGFPYGGTYVGPEAVLTGKTFSAPFAHVWNFRNGKAVRFRQHTDTAVVQGALK